MTERQGGRATLCESPRNRSRHPSISLSSSPRISSRAERRCTGRPSGELRAVSRSHGQHRRLWFLLSQRRPVRPQPTQVDRCDLLPRRRSHGSASTPSARAMSSASVSNHSHPSAVCVGRRGSEGEPRPVIRSPHDTWPSACFPTGFAHVMTHSPSNLVIRTTKRTRMSSPPASVPAESAKRMRPHIRPTTTAAQKTVNPVVRSH